MPDVLLQLRSHQYAYEASGVFSLRCNRLHAFHTSKVIAFSSFALFLVLLQLTLYYNRPMVASCALFNLHITFSCSSNQDTVTELVSYCAYLQLAATLPTVWRNSAKY